MVKAVLRGLLSSGLTVVPVVRWVFRSICFLVRSPPGVFVLGSP